MSIKPFDKTEPDSQVRQQQIDQQRRNIRHDGSYVSDEGSENYMAVFMNSDDSAVMQVPVWLGENETLLVKVDGSFQGLTSETRIGAHGKDSGFRFVRLTEPPKPRVTTEKENEEI